MEEKNSVYLCKVIASANFKDVMCDTVSIVRMSTVILYILKTLNSFLSW